MGPLPEDRGRQAWNIRFLCLMGTASAPFGGVVVMPVYRLVPLWYRLVIT